MGGSVRTLRLWMRSASIAAILLAALFAPAPAFTQLLPTELSEAPPSSFTPIATSIVELVNRARAGDLSEEQAYLLEQAILIVRQFDNYLAAGPESDGTREPVRLQEARRAVDILLASRAGRNDIAVTAFQLFLTGANWPQLSAERSAELSGRLVSLIYDMTEALAQVEGYLSISQRLISRGEANEAIDMMHAGVSLLRGVADVGQRLALGERYATELSAIGTPRALGTLADLVLSLPAGEERRQLAQAAADHLANYSERLANDSQAASPSTSASGLADAWRQLVAFRKGELSEVEVLSSTKRAALADDLRAAPLLLSLIADRAKVRGAVADVVFELLAEDRGFTALQLWQSVSEGVELASVDLALARHFGSRGYSSIAADYVDRLLSLTREDPSVVSLADVEAMVDVLVGAGDVQRIGRLSAAALPDDGQSVMKAVAEGLLRVAVAENKSEAWVALDALADLRLAPEVALARSLAEGLKAGNSELPAADLLGRVQPSLALTMFRESGRRAAGYLHGGETLAWLAGSSSLPLGWRAAAVAAALRADGDAAAVLPAAEAVRAIVSHKFEEGDALAVALATGDAAWPESREAAAKLGFAPLEGPKLASFGLAGRGRFAEAYAMADAEPAEHRDRLVAGIATVEAVFGDFETATDRIRAIDDHRLRVSALKRTAKTRALELDALGWLHPGDAEAGKGQELEVQETIFTAGGLSMFAAAHPSLDQSPPRPPLPQFDYASQRVLSQVPTPAAGVGGVNNGGEGRLIRLSRFVSKNFIGAQNAGVGDYLYRQNKTVTPNFIYLSQGVFTGRQLFAMTDNGEGNAVTVEGNAVTFHLPIVVGVGATLVLSGEEAAEFRLDTRRGAYLVNAGRLFVTGTRLVAFDTETKRPSFVAADQSSVNFRPFVISWGGSDTQIADAALVALGYSSSKAYGLTITVGPIDEISQRLGHLNASATVINSSLENMYYGFYASDVHDAVVAGNELRDNIVYGIDPHDFSKRLIFSFNSAYGTQHKHGMIISREVNDAFFVGNMSFDNKGSGLMLDRDSNGTIIYANTLVGNEGDGLAIFESSCNLLSHNQVSNNRRSGVKIRNSWDVQVAGNIVENNGGVGIEAYIDVLETSESGPARNFALDPYSPVVTASVVGNRIAGNRVGVQTFGLTELTAYKNRFLNQSPKLFAGDLKALNLWILQHSSAAPVTVRSQCVPAVKNRDVCPLAEMGLVASHVGTPAYSGPSADAGECVAAPGSVQAAAAASN